MKRKQILVLFTILCVLSVSMFVLGGCGGNQDEGKVIAVDLEIIHPSTGEPIITGPSKRLELAYDENFDGLELRFKNLRNGKYLTDEVVAPQTLYDLVEVSYREGGSDTIGGGYNNWPTEIGKYNMFVTFNVCAWTGKPFEYRSNFDDRFTGPGRSFILKIY